MKRLFMMAGGALLLSASLAFTPVAFAITSDTPKHEVAAEIVQHIEKLPADDADVQYYAYLDIDSADDSLHPVILAARNKIIHSQSWAANGASARVRDENGNIIEELPQFSDLFPEDWAVPSSPQLPIDEEYYKPLEK